MRQLPNQPANLTLAELKAIRQELEELRKDLRKELNALRDGLSDKVAKGVFIGSVSLMVATGLLYVLLSILSIVGR